MNEDKAATETPVAEWWVVEMAGESGKRAELGFVLGQMWMLLMGFAQSMNIYCSYYVPKEALGVQREYADTVFTGRDRILWTDPEQTGRAGPQKVVLGR